VVRPLARGRRRHPRARRPGRRGPARGAGGPRPAHERRAGRGLRAARRLRPEPGAGVRARPRRPRRAVL